MIKNYCGGGCGKINKSSPFILLAKTLFTRRLLLYPPPFHTGNSLEWTIILNSTRQIVGHCGLIDRAGNHAEVWYVIARSWQGQGFALEVLNALLAFGFNTLLLATIDAFVLAQNAASNKVVQKAGMHLFKILENHWYEENELHDVYIYTLSNHEFKNLP